MGAGPTGLTGPGRRFIVAGIVAALGAATAAGAEAELRARDHDARQRAQVAVAGAVNTRLTNLSRRVDQYAALLARTPQQRIEARLAGAPRTDLASIGVVTQGRGPADVSQLDHVTSNHPAGAQALTRDVESVPVQSAESIARDTAEPVAVVVGQASSASLIVAWPLYSGPLPVDTATRRAHSAGWVIGASSLADAIGPALSVFAPMDIESTLDASPAGPGAVQTVAAAATGLRVTHFPHQSRLPVLFILVVVALAAVAIAGFGVARRRGDKSAELRDSSLQQQVRLLSEISVTVQETLDIGVVLPAALTQISQAHALSYISVVTGNGRGAHPLLSIGRRPMAVPGPRWPVGANSASPGQLVRLPLQRATRTLGYVEVVPVRTLTQPELASLRSTTDLLANALHNAELYEREQETVRRLRDLDEMKDDFLSTVSHELRTPLSVLVGFMSLLARKWDRLTEDDRRDAVMKMQTHVTALAHLVNDLLDFVSERRNRESMPQELRLDHQVLAIVEQLRPLCERQELDVRLSQEVPTWTDPRAVERIVGNLVSNAAKYAADGTTIMVSAESHGDSAVVTVTDQGPGIGPVERQRVFERFYRGESEAARSTRGSGIGLAVVNEWLQAVGARLDIVSQPGVGTSMSVHFPAHRGAELNGAGTIRWLESSLAQRSLSHETA